MSGHHHSPLHNMSPAAHHILDLKKLHMFHFDVWQTDYIHYFEPILPAEWMVTAVEGNAYPHGHMLQSYERAGIMMSFAGPTRDVLFKQGGVHGNESFSLWMMPLPYEGKVIPHFMFYPAEILGLTPSHVIYYFQLTTEIPSWQAWKEELFKLLRLRACP